jgi:hypothetical protein
MTGICVMIAAATLGIDYGWQPVAGGGIEYIIQIEPQMIEALKDGRDIASDLPSDLRGVRCYRITVGTGPLPHQGDPPPVEPRGATKPAAATMPITAPPAARIPDMPPPSGPALLPPKPVTAAPQASTFSTLPPNTFQPVQQPDPFGRRTTGRDDANAIIKPALPSLEHHSTASPMKSASQHVPAKTEQVQEVAAAKPWVPLVVSLLGLFMSLGTNVYLGMVTWGLRARIQSMVRQFKTS